MYKKELFLRNFSEVMRISSEEMAINVQKGLFLRNFSEVMQQRKEK